MPSHPGPCGALTKTPYLCHVGWLLTCMSALSSSQLLVSLDQWLVSLDQWLFYLLVNFNLRRCQIPRRYVGGTVCATRSYGFPRDDLRDFHVAALMRITSPSYPFLRLSLLCSRLVLWL
jgi:hypothetical protein